MCCVLCVVLSGISFTHLPSYKVEETLQVSSELRIANNKLEEEVPS